MLANEPGPLSLLFLDKLSAEQGDTYQETSRVSFLQKTIAPFVRFVILKECCG